MIAILPQMDNCPYIEGSSGYTCILYHLGERESLQALTPEFRKEVCHALSPGYIPRTDEMCPVYEYLERTVATEYHRNRRLRSALKKLFEGDRKKAEMPVTPASGF
jgi:hypothetical protein